MKLIATPATPANTANTIIAPRRATHLQIPIIVVVALLAAGCANQAARNDASAVIRAEMDAATAARPAVVVPAQISDALQVNDTAAAAAQTPAEARFDLIVNNALAREVFLAMVTETRYSMLMHPDVTGPLSVTLRGVTVREALEAIRDVYGYDFKIDGRRITVFPPTLQTRIFTVNYLNAQREGRSEIRVNSGATSVPGSGSVAGQPAAPQGSGQSPQQQQAFENSRLATTSRTDFWGELGVALRGIVGAGVGRNVVVSPQSGVVAVRAMPDELRQVEAFLKATRISVQRQVMLEAKIVEVQLRDGFQSGVDWSLLRGRGTGGVVSTNTNPLSQLNISAVPPLQRASLPDVTAFPTIGNGLFGLVFSQTNFTGVLSFLETQGNVHILSSPRVSAMNNQKAVLKVGTDEYFVTGVTGGTISTGTTSAGNTTTLPTITLSSFFSGIALDVMPQIDQDDTITLHVHPSVSSVTEVVKVVDLGGSVGSVRLPLPANSSNETDTVVRVSDGNIVAIGGLMQLQSRGTRSGLPGSTNVPVLSTLLGNQEQTGSKREIVVLIKPTIIRSGDDWRELAREAKDRIEELGSARRVITINGATLPIPGFGK